MEEGTEQRCTDSRRMGESPIRENPAKHRGKAKGNRPMCVLGVYSVATRDAAVISTTVFATGAAAA